MKLSLANFNLQLEAFGLKSVISVLGTGNFLMLLGMITTVTTIVMCYGFETSLSIPTLVAGHITMLVAVTAIKIGYILHCVGKQARGLTV